MSYEELRVYFGGLSESGIWVLPLKALVAAFVFGQVLAWTYERASGG